MSYYIKVFYFFDFLFYFDKIFLEDKEERMLTKDIVLKYLKEYKKKHFKDYYIDKIGIFGSIVRDEIDEKSDLDIVIKFSKPNLFVQARIMQDLKEKFNINVDVVALSKSMNPKLLNRIEKEAIYV